MEKEIRITVHIHAAPEAVWDTLTNPAKIAQYMYGAIARTDWEPGSPVHYYFARNGQETLVVKGEVILNQAPRYLEHTLFPTTWHLPDIPGNYLSAVYQLTPKGDGTDLTVIQRDFSRVAEGEKRYHDALNGWSEILPKITAVAEGKS
ncbi:MAG: SRPBCC domain-containing protein [Cytophagales bacterium]|nr:SRPBCC domain-containing protein [Cytophagales bacterium]